MKAKAFFHAMDDEGNDCKEGEIGNWVYGTWSTVDTRTLLKNMI